MVITVPDENYPQHISMQATQDKVSMLDDLAIGTEVTAYINIRGREWTSPKTGEVKHFYTIECWRLEAGVKTEPMQDFAKESDNPPF